MLVPTTIHYARRQDIIGDVEIAILAADRREAASILDDVSPNWRAADGLELHEAEVERPLLWHLEESSGASTHVVVDVTFRLTEGLRRAFPRKSGDPLCRRRLTFGGLLTPTTRHTRPTCSTCRAQAEAIGLAFGAPRC